MSNVWGKSSSSAKEAPTVSESPQSSGPAPSSGVGRVKAVLSGDSFVVWVQRGSAAPEEVQITLSLLSAPRIARGKDAGTDQPWAWQSRESLRRLLQAKVVQFRIDYVHPTSGRQYAFVKTQDGSNVNLLVAQSGWARVQEPRAGKGPRGAEHVAMLEAGEKAQQEGRGIYSPDEEAAAASVRDVKEKFDSWALMEQIRDQLPVHGVVEGVLDGSTVRVLLVPSFFSIVVRLAGVQSPIWTRQQGDEAAAGRTAQPFAEQAKYMTEFCLLGRDVSVHVGGVNKDETFYGTVLFGGKNVAEELLKTGLARFVQWSAESEADRARFLQLEEGARSRSVGLWKSSGGGHGGPQPSSGQGHHPRGLPREWQGLVLDVRSGSRLTVEPEEGSAGPQDVFFSSVIAPKLNPKQPKEDEPCGFEAREFLRRKLIGKRVRVAFDYEKASRGGGGGGDEEQPSRLFYSVYLQNKHVPLLMVEQGLGQVITHRREEQRSREYSALMAAEEAARKGEKGIWNPDAEIKRVTDQSNMRGPQAKGYLKFVQQQRPMPAIVEFVMNPVRLKLYLPDLSAYISFTVAALRAPWQDDAFGAEAAAFARKHLQQRNLEIEVNQADKGGNFIGDATLVNSRKSVAMLLLSNGWASVSNTADRHPQYAEYQKVEHEAQMARKGIWRNWSPPEEERLDNASSAAASSASGGGGGATETGQFLVTEVTDGSLFYCQRLEANHQQQLEQLMGTLQRLNDSNQLTVASSTLRRNQLACCRYAEDGLHYRVRVDQGPSADRKYKVTYIDFGNSEVRHESELRLLPPSLSELPPQVIRCHLALLRVPGSVEDCGLDASQALKELTYGRVLMGSIEYREQDDYYVTLGDPSAQLNVNKEMVRMGLATVVKARKEARLSEPLKQLQAAQDEAKRSRLCLWRYGDVLLSDDDEE